jgi:phage repressor protein C with HTH and peptisase S24 domain
MTLGNQIKRYRNKAKLTLEELAELSGVPRGSIGAIERRNSTSSKFAAPLAAALNLTLDQLLDESCDHADQQPTEISDKLSANTYNFDNNIVVINKFDTRGSMGNGLTLNDQPGVIEQIKVTKEWLHKNVSAHTSDKNLCVVTGFGDSMKPTYNPGDPLIVDLGIKSVTFDAVFFFRIGNEGFIKRLQRKPGHGLTAKSDNPLYDSWIITDDMDFEIFGRVLKAWESKNF